MSQNSYSLKFTPIASEDLEQIYNYISGKLFAEISADKILARIESTMMRLKDFPYSGSFVLDEPLKSRGYRKLVIDSYSAFYLVDEIEKQVVIMRILYSAQSYQNLL